MKKSKRKQRKRISNILLVITSLNIGILYLYLQGITVFSSNEALRFSLIILSILITTVSVIILFKRKNLNYLILTVVNIFIIFVFFINKKDVKIWIDTGDRKVTTGKAKLGVNPYSRYRSY
jgi:hypothetical protein